MTAPLPVRARVLVIDDEVLLLSAYRRLMRRHHDVETAAGGREALALLEQDQAFDVILCDLLMPDLTGAELHREVASRWPALAGRFIFLTGGAGVAAIRLLVEQSGCPAIEKPVDFDELLRMIAGRLLQCR